LQALWTLDGLDAIESASVIAALRDPSRDVRLGAVRMSERWLRGAGVEPGAADAVRITVLGLAADPDWEVREQLGASLGELAGDAGAAAIARFLERNASDPAAMDAALSGTAGREPAVIAALMTASEETPQRGAALTMLAATIVSSEQDTPIQHLFEIVGDIKVASWQRSALLQGAEVALLGATAPGSAPGGRGRSTAAAADAPCPTCPGGRGGPGGAAAFPRPAEG
jgi:hypothetical protein